MYDNLFEPIEIAGLTVSNRIARAAHGTGMPWVDDSDELMVYHEERASAGVGLNFLERGGVHPSTTARLFPFYDDVIVPGCGLISETMHRHGSKMFVQLMHGGSAMDNGQSGPPWAPSPIPNPMFGVVPVTMTQGMIDEIVEGFATSARHAKEGGLDGIEIHAAHGYLVAQFLSPATNTRSDDYGGNLENRTRFLIEILDAVRAEVGDDYPVGIRVSVDEEVEGGLRASDTAEILKLVEDKIDLLSTSMSTYYRFYRTMSTVEDPHGYQLDASEVVTRAVSVPALVTGRITTLEHASRIVEDRVADMVSMVRALIADPHLVEKARDGRASETRPCTGTNEGCIGKTGVGATIGCIVNPAAGRETLVSFEPREEAESSKRVLVVGGGPAGLEAARAARLRGHEVELHELNGHLGGQVAVAGAAPHRAEVASIVDYLGSEIARLGVKVHLESTVDTDAVRRADPDVVIVATGSRPREDGFQSMSPTHSIPGHALDHVYNSWDVLGFGRSVIFGETALVYDDTGRYEAISVADCLLGAGTAVTFVTPHDTLGAFMPVPRATVGAARERLLARDFTLVPNARIEEITDQTVTARTIGTEVSRSYRAHTVVIVGYNVPQRALVDDLADVGVEVHVVGDAAGGHSIEQAIHEASHIAREI